MVTQCTITKSPLEVMELDILEIETSIIDGIKPSNISLFSMIHYITNYFLFLKVLTFLGA
jgi:hypothetical protein